MPLPVATRLVCQAIREEAESFRDPWNADVQAGIRRALGSVADRLEEAGSSVRPRTPPFAPDGAAVSSDASEPARSDKSHPGPEVVKTHPGPVNAAAVELKRLIDEGPYRLPKRYMQLLEDVIKLSS